MNRLLTECEKRAVADEGQHPASRRRTSLKQPSTTE
jgi:hypothetical protein